MKGQGLNAVGPFSIDANYAFVLALSLSEVLLTVRISKKESWGVS
jgi:hypothetical protein